MVANSLHLREYATREPVDGSAYHVNSAMAVVFVILALSLCLLLWALWEALSHLWRMRLRQRFFPATEKHVGSASPSTSTTTSSSEPGTPQDIEKGVMSSETPPNQLGSINALPRIIQDVELTSKTPGAHLTKTSLLSVHTGPKIFLTGPVPDEDFDIPPRSRTSGDGGIIPTPPPSALFITNPSPPIDTDGIPEHVEGVALYTSSNRPSAYQPC